MTKNVKETTIKLTPLDIQVNDYLADLFDDKDEVISEDKPVDKSNVSIQNIPEVSKNDEYTANGRLLGARFLSLNY